MDAKLVDLLIQREIIKEDDAPLYLYGLRNLFLDLLNIAVLTVISLILGMFSQFLIFMGFYVPLRYFAGGFHASSATKCFFFSVGIILVVFTCLKFIPWSTSLNLSIALISAAVIAFLAPVADANKPLDADENRVYRKMAIRVLGVQVIVFLILLYSGISQMAVNTITLVFAVMAAMLILGIGKQRFGAVRGQEEIQNESECSC